MTSKVLATSVKPIVASTIWVVFTLESARSSLPRVLSRIWVVFTKSVTKLPIVNKPFTAKAPKIVSPPSSST